MLKVCEKGIIVLSNSMKFMFKDLLRFYNKFMIDSNNWLNILVSKI